jgi:broad specificity phosphatase PhoE
VTAQLAWIDLTADDRDKIRRVLNLFNERGTVDELGLGLLRDTFSDALFPGTSVLHTRLRYMLFIPWIYQEIESWGGGYDVAYEARRMEMRLIEALAGSDDTAGIIGIQARESLWQLASTAYWAALVRWGIFLAGRNQGWYHTQFDGLLRRQKEVGRADDPGVVWTREPVWHPRQPGAPAGFPDEASFALTHEEADFLRGRIQERCGGSLLAWLAQQGSGALADSFWEEPAALHAVGSIAEAVELARRFSRHVEGAPLLYNLLLAEMRYGIQAGERDEELMESYRAQLAEWAAREEAEEPFEPVSLWSFVGRQGGRLVRPQQRFVEAWSRRVSEIGARHVVDDEFLRKLIESRERQLKGHRARVVNRGRLLDWGGRVGVGRMSFRWPNVRRLLMDLYAGFGR